MPVISFSKKGGRSVDSSDFIKRKKQEVLRASQSQKGVYKQVENKSFGSDTISSLLWANCAEACNGVVPLPPVSCSISLSDTNFFIETYPNGFLPIPNKPIPSNCTLEILANQTLITSQNYTFNFTINNFGTISIAGPSKTDPASILTNNGIINNNDMIENDGTIINNGTINNTGTIENYTGGTIENNSVINNDGTINNNGTIDNTNGTITNNPVNTIGFGTCINC